jgi:hypothetical protein
MGRNLRTKSWGDATVVMIGGASCSLPAACTFCLCATTWPRRFSIAFLYIYLQDTRQNARLKFFLVTTMDVRRMVKELAAVKLFRDLLPVAAYFFFTQQK